MQTDNNKVREVIKTQKLVITVTTYDDNSQDISEELTELNNLEVLGLYAYLQNKNVNR